MRIVFIIFIFLSLFIIPAFAQTSRMESEKIATFCKLWGFLKYYHPQVAKGKFDWDAEFTTRIKVLPLLQSKKEISDYYSDWVESLGKVSYCSSCLNISDDDLMFNFDLAWLSDTTLFTEPFIRELQFIRQNRNQKENYYRQHIERPGQTRPENEKVYTDSVFPSIELRLLGLSRYWNIIHYFYPYKYKIGQDWNSVLVEMIPTFKDSRDTISYHLAMLELTAKINDTHAGFVTKYTNQYFGLKWAPFNFKIINNKAIVTGFANDSLCKSNDIQYGDVFLTVNNVAIGDIIAAKSKYIGASNEAAKLRNFSYAIFNGQTDSMLTTFERNGTVAEKVIYRYLPRQYGYTRMNRGDKNDTCKILYGNIGYVNLGLLKLAQVDKALYKLKFTKAIIFDVRNYPDGTMYHIADFLNTEPKPFAVFTQHDVLYPGVYQYTEPYYCGRNNEDAYAGKVILLCNEKTQSHAEFTLMALQTAPNVTTIGSQTAGADGNVSLIIFPGNYKTYMSGLGVYYPDGRETQRVGITVDIEVKPTIEGLKEGRDEVMEKAIEVANRK